jgi:hypothetical protein
MHIVTRVIGLFTALFTTAYTQLTVCLLRIAKRLHVLIIQIYLSAQIRLHQLVQMGSSFKAWAVNQITAVPSTKQERSTAKPKATPTGSQPQTTVRRTRRPARPTRKKGS